MSYVTALNITRAGVYDLTAAANNAVFYQFPGNLRIVPAENHLPSAVVTMPACGGALVNSHP